METTIWSQLQNVFDNTTKSSIKRMNVMSTDHHDKLKAGIAKKPELQLLYDRFLVAYTPFKRGYQNMSAISGMYEGHTKIVADLFVLLSSDYAGDWDIAIQGVYRDKTPQYKMLLPNGRSFFQTGSYESRIREVEALSMRLANFSEFAVLSNSVANFAKQLEKARTDQQGFEKQEGDASTLQEELRLNLAKVMFANHGLMIDMFIDNLAYIENFYELKYLRKTGNGSNANAEEDITDEGDTLPTT